MIAVCILLSIRRNKPLELQQIRTHKMAAVSSHILLLRRYMAWTVRQATLLSKQNIGTFHPGTSTPPQNGLFRKTKLHSMDHKQHHIPHSVDHGPQIALYIQTLLYYTNSTIYPVHYKMKTCTKTNLFYSLVQPNDDYIESGSIYLFYRAHLAEQNHKQGSHHYEWKQNQESCH